MNKGLDASWNLIDQPWIPCDYADGHREISLKTFFRDAPQIRTISGDIPQQTLSLLRLALAILYRAYSNDGEEYSQAQLLEAWKAIWDDGGFDTDVIEEYLDEFHDCFYLINPDQPFYQTPGLEYLGDKAFDSISEMIADVPKPEKFLFSTRAQNSLRGIDFAQAARYLIFMQAYDTAGIKSPVKGNTHINKGRVYAPKGAVGTGWLGAIGGLYVEGSNLFETLMLNWCMYVPSSDIALFGKTGDLPPWEKEEDITADLKQRTFTGPVDALTWQSRRIRLVTNDDQTQIIGVIGCYGDITTPHNTDQFEKMTAWRLSEPQKKKLGLPVAPRMPLTHDASKALWRGLTPILEVDAATDLRPGIVQWMEELRRQGCFDSNQHVLSIATIHAQGMTYGTQSSVYETGIDDSVKLDTVFFRKDYPAIQVVADVVEETEKAVNSLANFVKNLQAAAGDKAIGALSQASAQKVREEAYSELDAIFRERLADFSEDKNYETYGNEWRDDIHRLLLHKGRQYLSQSYVPVFAEHEAGNMGRMNAPRAQILFHGGLNKILGRLPKKDNDAETFNSQGEQ